MVGLGAKPKEVYKLFKKMGKKTTLDLEQNAGALESELRAELTQEEKLRASKLTFPGKIKQDKNLLDLSMRFLKSEAALAKKDKVSENTESSNNNAPK